MLSRWSSLSITAVAAVAAVAAVFRVVCHEFCCCLVHLLFAVLVLAMLPVLIVVSLSCFKSRGAYTDSRTGDDVVCLCCCRRFRLQGSGPVAGSGRAIYPRAELSRFGRPGGGGC